MARRRGEDHHAVELPEWVNHDLRRVVRSGLSALARPAQRRGSRACAPASPASSAPTTFMSIEDEKREALEAWAQRLASIVNPPATPAKVVKLRRRRR